MQAASVAFVSVLAAGSALAGDWTLTDSVSLNASAINRDSDNGGQSDRRVLSLNPSLSLSGRGGRTTANVRYGLGGVYENGSNSGSRLTHSLNGTASSRIYEDNIFLEGSAFAGLASATNSSASVDEFSAENETIQTYAFSLSPILRYHLGRNADLVSRNTIRYSGSDRGSGDEVISRQAHIGIQNGQRFSRLDWFADYSNTVTEFSNREESVDSFNVGTGYRLNRKWRLNGSVGYSESDAPTSRSDNSDFNWNLGATWTPSPRTSMSGNYGQNYSGQVWNGNIAHKTRRTTLSGYFSRSLTNASALLLDTQDLAVIDPTTGDPFLDPQTGDPLIISVPVLVPTTQNFINTTVGASVTVSGRRSSVTGQVTYSDREFDLTGRTEDQTTYRLSANRNISPRTSIRVSGGYSEFSSSTGGENNTTDMSLGASTQLGRHSSLNGSVSHRIFESSTGNGYEEQRISLSFVTKFL